MKSILLAVIICLLCILGMYFILYTISNVKVSEVRPVTIQQKEYPLSTFDIYYKDGTKGKARAYSIIYGQTDDNIYFIGKDNDTINVLPKIIVEDVREISEKIRK